MEEWKDIPNFEGAYQASSLGRIKNIRTGTILKPGLSNRYKFVSLWINGAQHGRKVHSLVANAFLARPEWAECVNHKDGDRLNNQLTNLEWTTHKENAHHARDMGLSKKAVLIHGTPGGYNNWKCRCSSCTEAWRGYYHLLKNRKGALL